MILDFSSLRVTSVPDTILCGDSIPVRFNLVAVLEDREEEFDLTFIQLRERRFRRHDDGDARMTTCDIGRRLQR